MNQWYLDNGATQETADKIAGLYIDGETPDSANPNSTPVNITEHSENGFTITKTVFEDGSFVINGVENPNESVVMPKALGVTGCVLYSSSPMAHNYKECFAYIDSALATIGFHADISTFANGGIIKDIYSPYSYAQGPGVTTNTPSISIIQSSSSGSQSPATAKGVSAITYKNGSVTNTVTVYLKVKGSYWSEGSGL